MAKETLTAKQRRFVAEYLKDSNGKQSAIRAGYAPKAAEVQASELLRLPKVQNALKLKVDKIEAKCELSREWVLKRLMSVAERCMEAEPVMMRQDGELVESGEFKFDSSGANRALELLGKTKAMFVERTEMSGELAIKGIEVNFVKAEVK